MNTNTASRTETGQTIPDTGLVKLEQFTSVIVADAMTESKAVYEQIRQETQDAMTAAEDEALADAFRFIKMEMGKINAECGRRLSLVLMEKKRERFKMRTEMADAVFVDVQKQLGEFVKTPAYIERLKALLTMILDEFKGDTTVFLREEDMHLQTELTKLKTPYKLDFKQGVFRLGGLEASCESRMLHVDESFDSKMDDLQSHFAGLFGLKLDA